MRSFFHYSIVTVGNLFLRGINFLNSVILARILSQAEFGGYSLFYSVLLTIKGGFGFVDTSYVRHSSRYTDREKDYLSAALILKILIILVLIATSFPLSIIITNFLQKPELKNLVLLGIISGSLLNLLSLKASFYQKDEKFISYSLINALFGTLVFLSLVTLYLLKNNKPFNLNQITYLYTFLSILTFFIVFLLLKKNLPTLGFPKDILKDYFFFGFWVLMGNLCYLVFRRLDIILLTKFTTMEQVAIYGVALKIGSLVGLTVGPIAVILLPRASRFDFKAKTLKNYVIYGLPIIVITTLFLLIVFLVIPIVIEFFFGAKYLDAVNPARIFVLGELFVSWYTVFYQLFYAEDLPKKVFYLSFIRLITTLFFGFLFIPRYFTMGASLTFLLSSFSGFLYVLFTVKRSLVISYHER